MRNVSYSFALIAWICWSLAIAAESPEEFLEAYRAKSKVLVEKYEHVHLSARIEERIEGYKQGSYNIEFFQDGSKIKTAKRYNSGERLSKFDATTTVLTPDKSFILQKPLDQPEFFVGLIGDKNSEAAPQAQRKVESESRVLAAPFACIGVPLLKFLTMRETKIINVKEERISGKKIYNVATHTAPFSKDFEGWCDYIEGSFLFEPAAHWVLRKYALKYWKKNRVPATGVTCSVDYREPIDEVPVLRGVQLEYLDDKGNSARGYRADIKVVEFGAVSPDEFTLSGCGLKGAGVLEDKPSKWPPMLFWSVGTVILALILIYFIRRRMAKKLQGAR